MYFITPIPLKEVSSGCVLSGLDITSDDVCLFFCLSFTKEPDCADRSSFIRQKPGSQALSGGSLARVDLGLGWKDTKYTWTELQKQQTKHVQTKNIGCPHTLIVDWTLHHGIQPHYFCLKIQILLMESDMSIDMHTLP